MTRVYVLTRTVYDEDGEGLTDVRVFSSEQLAQSCRARLESYPLAHCTYVEIEVHDVLDEDLPAVA
jgi:hypothetical protein